MPLPKCHALGCDGFSDPRQAIHGPDGRPVPACDGHGMAGICTGDPCVCPAHVEEPGPVPAWQAACERIEENHRRRALADAVLSS